MDNQTQEAQSLLVTELLKDRRRERFWKNVRWALAFTPLLVLMAASLLGGGKRQAPGFIPGEAYVAVVKIHNEIMPKKEASAEKVNPALIDAFKDTKAKGVLLVINSPGGTPVQAAAIHDRILALRKEFPAKKLVVVGEDMMTSGAYLIAVAAPTVYAARSSVVGSIGVISQSFGFTGVMDKVGVENRTLTSGESKARLSPFAPLKDEDKAKMEGLLAKIHDQFKDIVKAGREGKLKGDEAQLFSGDFWTGEEAMELGLIDGMGTVHDVLKKEFDTTQVREYKPAGNLFDTLVKDLGAQAKAAVAPAAGILAMPEGF